MKRSLKQKWMTWLIEHPERQGRGRLAIEGGHFCCLGELGLLIGCKLQTHIIKYPQRQEFILILPEELREDGDSLGIIEYDLTKVASEIGLSADIQHTLTQHNDGLAARFNEGIEIHPAVTAKSFPEIAVIIQELVPEEDD